MTGPGFVAIDLSALASLDLPGVGRARVWAGRAQVLEPDLTHTVLAAGGSVQLRTPAGQFCLGQGMYAVVAGHGQVEGGQGLLISTALYRGLFQLGGPPESSGRLRYIDGCTDTLLVCPPRLGEPCLNHLHLPAGTLQTHHTHPSDRVGIIARGSGWACAAGQRVALRAGMGWWIRTGTAHHFETESDSLDVLAWHPDSDFGPTDAGHPMINRTVLAGPPIRN